jgi:DNA-binding beta-propeller fold protein YncE
MIRHIALGFTALLVSVGGAAANTAHGMPHDPLVQRYGWMDAHADRKHVWMYVAGFTGSVIGIYDLSNLGHKIGEITRGLKGPAGIALDAHGTLYVVNYLGGNATIYPPEATAPSLTLPGLTNPVGVAVNATGDVYITNSGEPPSILVYPPGQTTPSRTITSDLITEPNQITFNSSGNLYFTYWNMGVSEIPYGSQQPVSLGLQGLTDPAGIAIDPLNGNLFVSNDNQGTAVHVFAPGSVKQSRQLSGSHNADYLAIGDIKGKEYVFAPQSQSSSVVLYEHNRDQPFIILQTLEDAHGIAIKARDVP